MIFKYQFSNETIETDVDEGWGSVLKEIERSERNNNRRETMRHESYSDNNDKIEILIDNTVNIEEDVFNIIQTQALYEAISKLFPQQRELIQKIYFEGRSIRSIALEENVHHSSVEERLNRIIKKLKKLLEQTPANTPS